MIRHYTQGSAKTQTQSSPADHNADSVLSKMGSLEEGKRGGGGGGELQVAGVGARQQLGSWMRTGGL